MIGMALEPDAWGSGAAGEALELMLGFLFLDLGLHVAYLWTLSANVRAVRLAEKTGFRIGVRSRESAYKRGVLCDTLRMDIVREEYMGPRGLMDTLPGMEDAG
jgi:RimJ/RimL family protein N-acetyltransferase